MSKKRKTSRAREGYEIWSAGRTKTWMKGLGLFDNGMSWWMAPPMFRCDACILLTASPPTKRKRERIFEDYVEKLDESTAIIYDPLAPLRFIPAYETDMKKRLASFLKQYPQCGSIQFNGGLVLHGSEIPKGMATAHELYSFVGGYSEMSIVLKRNRVLVVLCHHQGLHIRGRDAAQVDAFARVYRRHMFVDAPVWEEDS